MKIYVAFKDGLDKTFECDRTVSVTDTNEFSRLKLFKKNELTGIIPYENILYWVEVSNEGNN